MRAGLSGEREVGWAQRESRSRPTSLPDAHTPGRATATRYTAAPCAESMSTRDLEPGIVTDLANRLTYGGYLRLDRLLDAQQPLSAGPDARRGTTRCCSSSSTRCPSCG